MRFQLTAVGLACTTLLSACGGGGGAATGNKAQSVDFPYPGARYLATPPAALLATTSSGLAVTFVSNTPATCTVADGKLVPVKPGECSVTASQAGDSTYAAATSQQLFKVMKHVQAITFASPGFQPIGGTPPALAATADSGLAVSFASATPDVCTVSGTQLTLVSKGQCAITASQAGTDDYDVAPAKQVTFTVGDAPPPVLTFLSGYQSTSLTTEGGAVNVWSGSNKDGWWCSDPNWCSATMGANGSSLTYQYVIQPNDPKHPNTDTWIGAYFGVDIMAPGVASISKTGDTTTGLKVDKQTTLKLNVAQNAEWFSSAVNDVKVTLNLGHHVTKADGSACNIGVNTTFKPTAAAATTYEVQLASFTAFSENCGRTDLVPAVELSTYTIVNMKFEGAQTNTTVLGTPEPAPSYPTALTLTGAITLQ